MKRFLIIAAILAFAASVQAQNTLAGSLTIQKWMKGTGDLTPPEITANQNNYNPTGFGDALALRLTADTGRTITGLVPTLTATTPDGRFCYIFNVDTADSITLANDSSSSTAANRMLLGSDVVLEANGPGVLLMYDDTTHRWRIVGGAGGGSSGSGTVTSIELDMPSADFNVSGGPITDSGTLTVTYKTQTANRVMAGPTNGSAATPTFRALVTADIPDLSALYQPVGAYLTGVIADGPLTGDGTSGSHLSIPRASASVDGYLHKDDFAAFEAGAGGGTVESVGLVLPVSLFSVSGSPVTTTGDLTGALIVQNANKVFAGPTTGADATPTFRALVVNDIPSLSALYEVPLTFNGGLTRVTNTVSLSSIPSGTPAAGTIPFTAIAAPSTPSAGVGSVYVDSTSKNLAVKDDAGAVKHGVQTLAPADNTFVTGINDAGLPSTGTSGQLILDFLYATAPAGATGSNGSWSYTLPTGAKSISFLASGAGGGGGAGARFTAGTILRGGGAGGPGGRVRSLEPFPVASLPGTTFTISVPAGGAGAVGQTADTTAGANGSTPSGPLTVTAGGEIILSINSGSGGTGGGNAAGGQAGNGANSNGNIVLAGLTNGQSSGGAGGTAQNGTSSANIVINGQASTIAAQAFSMNVPNAGGGAAITAGSAVGVGGSGGGWIYVSGGAVFVAGGSAGTVSVGGDGVATRGILFPSAPGGGASNATGPGYAGGNGIHGTPGAGGGASLNGNTSGAGGNGGDGWLRLIVYF